MLTNARREKCQNYEKVYRDFGFYFCGFCLAYSTAWVGLITRQLNLFSGCTGFPMGSVQYYLILPYAWLEHIEKSNKSRVNNGE